MSTSSNNVSGDAPAAPNVSTGDSPQTVIGEEVRLVGTLYSSAELLITGQIQGDVECPTLTVGTGGYIDGSVKANSVVVQGEVLGDIEAGDVKLNPQSRVSGNISCRSIAIEHGAAFEGAVQQMYDLEKAAEPSRSASNKNATAALPAAKAKPASKVTPAKPANGPFH